MASVTAWWTLIPFALMLAAIAVCPLLPATAHRWEDWRFQLAIALGLGVPVAAWLVASGEAESVGHAGLEYFQFIALLFSLYTVSGGIYLSGDIHANPRNNTIFLALGGAIASVIGTTGAAMLLIRPLLNTNAERKLRVHTVVFAIFVVANCGGLLTPLGDPPLFLGMLRGVPFTWTFGLFPEWLFTNGLLLLTYYALDRRLYGEEAPEDIYRDDTNVKPLGLHGHINIVFLAVIVLSVALMPSVDLHAIEEGHAQLTSFVPWRELVMLGVAGASFLWSDREARFVHNAFTWGPIVEVGVLFIGIFLTMIPALHYLAAIAPSLPLNQVSFFAFTGVLSSVLDNAPTYATFFEMAATLPGEPRIAGVPEVYLVAISLGAVMCGAMTYIGNGPNFMVKSVAESAGVKMPSFGGYVVWSMRYLAPILVAMMLVFVAPGLWPRIAGIALAVLIVGRALLVIHRAEPVKHLESVAKAAD
ncbi:transporter, UIT6 family [Austwickia chelonae]|uniref:sodium:proton antiporter n=1 Tax=Austwickia chelonae TaxID=100225 RepID=UPI00058D8315|nr:sodium:proton antiporter [Austwickia chelonae]SEV86862.1 transporter, UIT6 family [Austwickia chelonae]